MMVLRGVKKVFRFFASLFGTSQAYWATNPTTYWQQFDRLVDDIEAAGMSAIPSMGTGEWHLVANKLHPGLNETVRALCAVVQVHAYLNYDTPGG